MAELSAQMRSLYLDYAVAVVTSRALPDARDGLKPVQRRILYAMANDLRLSPGSKHRKSAAIVGRVLGTYHPHGDQAVYDAMVRMAQEFSLRYPLVDGQGNFGSIDGDGAASMRYTEARLAPMAERLLNELGQDTVDFVENYDQTSEEPSVLPAEVPNMLMNGAQGIAVGMATNIPPHNASELLDALVWLCDHSEATTAQLVERFVPGPDFPSGGVIVENADHIRQVYEEGSGTLTMRSVWNFEDAGRGKRRLVVTELPYQVNKAKLFEAAAQAVYNNEVPQIEEVRDESTDDIRLVFDLKKGADEDAALAYLLKHTELQSRFHVNLTCLMPEGANPRDPDVPLAAVPRQVGLAELLRSFLDHRVRTVARRSRHALAVLRRRIHILEGFEAAFADIDRLVSLVRASSTKSEARTAVANAFSLDEAQSEAVVAMALHRLASTQIEDILNELATKRAEAQVLVDLLESPDRMVRLVKQEFAEAKRAHGDVRRTRIDTSQAKSYDYEEDAYIQSEDVVVVLTRGGWIRSQKSYTEVANLRCREGDAIGWVLACNTKDALAVFTSRGKCYTVRVADLERTTGYGNPIQTLFTFEDGESVVSAFVVEHGKLPTSHMISMTSDGFVCRFALVGYHEPSQVGGRLYHRVLPGAHVVAVECVKGGEDERVVLATRDGKGISFTVGECRIYNGAGKGIRAIKLVKKDEVLACMLLGPDNPHKMAVSTNRGAERQLTHNTYASQNRGGKGFTILKRGHLAVWTRPVVEGGVTS